MQILEHVRQSITLLVILSVLVVAHEWGHFIVARLCGIRVDDFSIGFGKRLFRIGKRGDTEYNVRMLPLGGFVKIAGMEPDEAPLVAAKDKVLGKHEDPDAGQIPLVAENVGENTAYTAPDGFYSKPLWQRSLVIFAGPLMSFLFGYFVFCLMGVTTGIPTGPVTNRIDLAGPDGEGKRVGLKLGDHITAINGIPITSGQQMVDLIHGSPGKPITLTVQREGTTFSRVATPKPIEDEQGKPAIFVDVVAPGPLDALGVQTGDTLAQIAGADVTSADQARSLLKNNAGKHVDVVVQRDGETEPVQLSGGLPADAAGPTLTLNPHEVGLLNISPTREVKRVGLADSIEYGNQQIADTFIALAFLIHHRELHKATGGIVFMYQATGFAVKNGANEVVSLMAGLSISLAVFNLLPIPILDGGHLLTFFIEWVRRGKRLTDQQQAAFLMTGLAIIGILFILINSHDIIRTLTHQLPQ